MELFMQIKKFLKNRSIWLADGNVKSIYEFKMHDEICFHELPKEFSSDKNEILYNFYILNNSKIQKQLIVDQSIINDLSDDLYQSKKLSSIKVENKLIPEIIIDKEKSYVNSDLLDKLVGHAEKFNNKYVGKENLIANSDILIPYFEKFAESLILVANESEKKISKNKSIKNQKDVISFLEEEMPNLDLKNNYPKKEEPFSFLDKMETFTLANAMNAKTWIKDKDLNMISVSVLDGIDVLSACVLFSKYEFVKGCEKVSNLDTLVRDYFKDDFYDWKNDFQSFYKKDKSEGHKFEKKMKIKYNYEELNKEIIGVDSENKVKPKTKI